MDRTIIMVVVVGVGYNKMDIQQNFFMTAKMFEVRAEQPVGLILSNHVIHLE